MELPPELRLNVYEALLVESETLHPAILRTSRQVHAEALPVLYKRNKFLARVKYCTVESYWRGVSVVGCCLKINRSVDDSMFRQHVPRHLGLGTLRRRLFRDRSMSMLRMLTHFTIDIDAATPGKEDTKAYVCQAYDAILSLCLAFIGHSKLKELSIKINTSVSHVTRYQPGIYPLARCLSPYRHCGEDRRGKCSTSIREGRSGGPLHEP